MQYHLISIFSFLWINILRALPLNLFQNCQDSCFKIINWIIHSIWKTLCYLYLNFTIPDWKLNKDPSILLVNYLITKYFLNFIANLTFMKNYFRIVKSLIYPITIHRILSWIYFNLIVRILVFVIVKFKQTL